MDTTWGGRLRAARHQAGFKNQQELAEKIGVSSRTIRSYEGDKYRPPPEVLVALRRVLGDFDTEGDPVEVAVRRSELVEWRQTKVIGVYQEQMYEQRRERGERGAS